MTLSELWPEPPVVGGSFRSSRGIAGGIAMRAGMTGHWSEAVAAFDARTYGNRLGIDSVRADEPNQVQEALGRAGAATIAWYGVRLFTDHWGHERPGEDFPATSSPWRGKLDNEIPSACWRRSRTPSLGSGGPIAERRDTGPVRRSKSFRTPGKVRAFPSWQREDL